MSFEDLVGKTITAVYLNDGGECIQFKLSDGTRLSWDAVGDCCAHAYFYQLENFEWLIDEVVLGVKNQPSTSQSVEWGELDTEFITIATRKGEATIEMRTEHNGYYCGWAQFTERDDFPETMRFMPKQEKK